MAMHTINPPGWKRGAGYSHAIELDGRLVVAGVLPWSTSTHELQASGFAAQWAVALENVADLLAAAGYAPSEVISMRIFVADMEAYKAAAQDLGDAWQRIFGRHFPAITLVGVAALVHNDALLEVEAEAVRMEAA